MPDTVLRLMTMLRHVPRQPSKVSASWLEAQLRDAGYQVSRRSLERDLLKLAKVFPLTMDEHKPRGWSFSERSAVVDLPSMDVHTALAFRMAEAHLLQVLPAATCASLEPHFARARLVLQAASGNALHAWPEKVRVLPTGLALLPPVIDRAVLEKLQAALLTERRLKLVYHRRGESNAKRYVAHPQALVWRGAVGYLLCTLFDYADVVQLAVHRIESAEVEKAPRRPAPAFSLDKQVASAELDFLLSDDILPLELRMPEYAAVKLRETPLCADQTLHDLPDGRVAIGARVPDTVQLRTWLLGFGANLEVVGPPMLRAEMATHAQRMAAIYQSNADRGGREVDDAGCS